MTRFTSLLALLFVVVNTMGATPTETYESGVVGLEVTYQEWDQDRPWAKTKPGTRTVAGVLLEGHYILTSARMVANATYIQVKKAGRPTQVEPRMIRMDPDMNLALLAIDDAALLEELRPVRLADETPVDGVVQTVRWKKQQLESAASRIKRFEVQSSYFGSLKHVFLLVQTDLMAGGWSEPVFYDGQLVGLTISQEKQSARIIPVEILSAFLDQALSAEPYEGFPSFGAHWQTNSDPSLVAFLGQTGEPRGAVIRNVPWGFTGCGVLKPRDILLSIDGKAIDAEGYCTHPRLGQIEFTDFILGGYRIGDVVPVQVLRDRRVVDLQLTLRGYPSALNLMPARRGDEPPPYLVAGGLVLRELDANYLRTWGKEWSKSAALNLLTYYQLHTSEQQPSRRRVIVLTAVLPSDCNIGYQDLRDLRVESINGRMIDSIPAAVEAFEHPEDGFHTIVLEPNLERREIVLDAELMEAETAEILSSYGIPAAVRLPSLPPPEPGPCGAPPN